MNENPLDKIRALPDERGRIWRDLEARIDGLGGNVTEADRDKAIDIMAEHGHGDPDPFGEMREAIAAALAEEREKARAPFLALADEAERKGRESSFRDFAGNPWPAHIYPHDIRRAAEKG